MPGLRYALLISLCFDFISKFPLENLYSDFTVSSGCKEHSHGPHLSNDDKTLQTPCETLRRMDFHGSTSSLSISCMPNTE